MFFFFVLLQQSFISQMNGCEVSSHLSLSTLCFGSFMMFCPLHLLEPSPQQVAIHKMLGTWISGLPGRFPTNYSSSVIVVSLADFLFSILFKQHWPVESAVIPPQCPDRSIFQRAWVRELCIRSSVKWAPNHRVWTGAPAKLQVVTSSDGSLTLRPRYLLKSIQLCVLQK